MSPAHADGHDWQGGVSGGGGAEGRGGGESLPVSVVHRRKRSNSILRAIAIVAKNIAAPVM